MNKIFIEDVHLLMTHLDSKKAERISLHDFSGRFYYADWSIICSARSAMHAKFLHREVIEFFKERKVSPYSSSKRPQHFFWIIADFGSLIVNVFTGNFREKYDLESVYAERFPEISQKSLQLV